MSKLGRMYFDRGIYIMLGIEIELLIVFFFKEIKKIKEEVFNFWVKWLWFGNIDFLFLNFIFYWGGNVVIME